MFYLFYMIYRIEVFLQFHPPIVFYRYDLILILFVAILFSLKIFFNLDFRFIYDFIFKH